MSDLSIDQLGALFEEAPVMLYVAGIALFNLSITGLEIFVDFIGRKKRRWGDSLANITLFAFNTVIERTAYGLVGFLGLSVFYYLSPLTISMTPVSWILAIIAADFTYYWMHRVEHKCRLFWAHHSVHHSSEDLNLTVAFRLSIVEGLFEWVFLIPMILIGFNPFQAIIGIVLVAQYQHWIHLDKVGKLGWIEGVLNTPSAHRVHHGSNRQYWDRNFGGIFMIWDRVFGTYAVESEKVIFGLDQNIGTNNPIKITFIEYLKIWRDMKRYDKFGHKLKVLFGPLNWRPKLSKVTVKTQ